MRVPSDRGRSASHPLSGVSLTTSVATSAAGGARERPDTVFGLEHALRDATGQ